MTFRCRVCGEMHGGLPDIGIDRPAPWWDVPEAERDERLTLTADTCVLDDMHYFLRGVIEIPVVDHAQSFGFGAWISQGYPNYLAYVEAPHARREQPTFGWLCTHLGCYTEPTYGLKCRVHFPGGDLRPLIELEPSDHPLAVEQRDGITLQRAWEIVHGCTGEGGA